MYRSASPSSSSATAHPTSRPVSRSSLPFPAVSSASRPSSAGSVDRSTPPRVVRPSYGPDDLDGYDDTDDLVPTPQPSSSCHFAAPLFDDAYASVPTLVARRSSGPRLPPLPVNSPFDVAQDTFRPRPLSVASTVSRRTRPPSIVMTPAGVERTFLRRPHPSRTSHRENGSSSDDDDHRRPVSALMPRSALANYFNLDFSFLDDEPPFRKTAYGRRAQQEVRQMDRSTCLHRPREPRGDEDYFSMKCLSASLPASKRDSVGSTASGLPFPSSNLPFPSRPGNPRRVSSESVSSRWSSIPSPGERPYLTSRFSSSVDGRHPSMASYILVESTGSGASSQAYASRRSPTSPTFPPIPDTGPDAAEKRKRLAAFLDETASAMEGGKSLMMVVPELQPAAPQHKSLSELAEEQVGAQPTPRSASRDIEYRHPFDGKAAPAQCASSPEDAAQSPTAPSRPVLSGEHDAPVSPTTRAPEVQVQEADEDERRTVYYTPKSVDHEAEAASGTGAMTFSEALALEGDPPGLGFSHLDSKSQPLRPHPERSPSTVRVESPTSLAHRSPAPPSSDPEQEADKHVKRLEKRRKIISELVETETSYAIDMAVVRDIYLARARGAHMAQIADHVMSTGLGLGHVGSTSPPSPAVGSRRKSHLPETNRRQLYLSDLGAGRRASSAPFLSGKLDQRRPTVVPSLPTLMPGQPLMAEKDLHVIFANLEEIAAFAEGFATALDAAAGTDDPDAVDDRIGEIFVDMIPRIQQVYSTYCVRHHRAILRLQELEPTLRTYFSECKTLSHGRTNAWDLASLLIKPVQRCLKYPLLLDQILAVTPEAHPDRVALQRANAEMLLVAEHINEVKKKQDAVSRVVNKEKTSQRRDSSRSISSSVTKKLLRSSQKAKTAFGFAENGGDEMFDTLVALVDSTRSGVLRFSNEMREWTKSTKAALEAQVNMVEGWITMYAPMAGERHSAASMSHRRLCIFLDEVLIPIIEGPWRELDYEVRRSLILKTDHLLSLFESPRQVIAKRNDKMLDHSRYLAKKMPVERRGSEEFLLLSSQLLEELPRFLGSVSRYFNIIVGHFAGAQAAYHESVQERWNAFAEQWLVQVEGGEYDDIEASFSAQHEPLDQMMDTLAAGLGLAVAHSSSGSPLSRQRMSRLSHVSSALTPPSSGHTSSHPITPEEPRLAKRQSYISNATDYSSDRRNRGSVGSTYRSSVTSDSSAPSLRPSSADGSGSSREPTTPPPLQPHFPASAKGSNNGPSSSRTVVHEPLGGYDRRSMAMRCDQALPPPPVKKVYVSDESDHTSSTSTFVRDEPQEPVARERAERSGRAAKELREKYLSTYSVYLPAAEDKYEDDEEFGDGPLYIAEAVNPSRSSAFRSGYPIFSFNAGERFYIELEEADHVEGGSGWLLGRKMEDDNSLGWARTEDFVMVDEGAEGEAESP